MRVSRFRWFSVSALCLGLWVVGAQAGPDHKDHKPGVAKETVLPKCPVTGEPVDFSVKTMTDDGPVFFCCDKCIKKFKDKAETYQTAVEEQRKVLAKMPKVQVACPVSGKPVDTEVHVERDGRKVFFCCKGCIEKYEKAPDKYKAGLADSYTYQTKCPVTGDEIDPESFVKLAGGQTIYFCCPPCEKKLFKDPATYAPNLKAQGIPIDPKNVKRATERKADEPEGHGHDHNHGE